MGCDVGAALSADWAVPVCVQCGRELLGETFVSEMTIRVVFSCPEHGLQLIGDPLL